MKTHANQLVLLLGIIGKCEKMIVCAGCGQLLSEVAYEIHKMTCRGHRQMVEVERRAGMR